MTYAVAVFRRHMLSGALLVGVAASVLPRGGTLACLAAWTFLSLSAARCRYPYKRRRGRLSRVLLAYLSFALVFLALTAFEISLLPPPVQKSGAAVFGVCAAADAAGVHISRKHARALNCALFLLDIGLYAL